MAHTFPFRFDPRFRRPLALLGVTEKQAAVTVGDHDLTARFGLWSVATPLGNVAGTEITGPYTWYRVIGPHLSLADRGLTFGTNTERGLCIRFRQPIRGMDPAGLLHHPGLTVTVEDCEGLASQLAARS